MPHRKHALALVCAVLCACAEGADEGTMTEDTLAMEPAEETIALADVAGTWNLDVRTEQGDSVPGLQLVATADASGWSMVYPGRDPIPVTVETMGDSIMTVAGPFSSLIREGVMVTSYNTYRLEGDRLVGSGSAHYQTTESDSVVGLMIEGTRAP